MSGIVASLINGFICSQATKPEKRIKKKRTHDKKQMKKKMVSRFGFRTTKSFVAGRIIEKRSMKNEHNHITNKYAIACFTV